MGINLKVKLYLEDENSKFMGIGVLWLLKAIEKNNSLRKAATELGISYSKAYAMIKNLERALGKDILSRKRGGSTREGCTLTPFACSFINLYDSFQSSCKTALDPLFSQFINDLEKLS